jgi:hypothetical protein
MATAKQLAALAKARAARAKKAAKKPTTKKKKVAVKAPSRATGKAPSKRLQTRRVKNTATGYYPSPAKKSRPKTKTVHLLCVFKGSKRVGYWTGSAWDDNKNAAKCYATQQGAATAWTRAAKNIPAVYRGGVVTEKK